MEATNIERAAVVEPALSSAYAAVRSDDGLCAMHDRYVAADCVCSAHAPGLATALRLEPDNRRKSVLGPYR
jgi:hypothetical protein